MQDGLSRWLAATELIRAADLLRDVAAVGRLTREDSDRLHAAEHRWDELRPVRVGAAR